MDQSKPFYRALISLALPIIAQNLLSSAVGAADTFMMSAVGQTQLSAVSLANQLFFVLTLFFTGLTGSTAVMLAQYLGKKDHESASRLFAIACLVCEAVCLCFALLAVACPGAVMRVMTNDAALISEGAAYLRIAGVSYAFMGFSQIYFSLLKSLQQTGKSMRIAVLTLLVNLSLNTVFIFGLLGAPKLGVRGAALATCIARALECLICAADSVRRKPLPLSRRIEPSLLRDFIRIASPMTLQGFVWGGAMAVISAIMGRLGSDMVAAHSVAASVQSIATVACFGLADAGSILLGKDLGGRRFKEAEENSRRLLRIAVLFGAAGCAVMLLAEYPVTALLPLTAQAKAYLGVMYKVLAVNAVFAAVTYTMLCGVFPAGGDTRYGLFIDGVVMWSLIALGSVAAFALHLHPLLVFLILNIDELTKTPCVIRQYRKRNWINDITRKQHAAGGVTDQAS